ncbi:hypothetical protein S83_057980, partial [Arachis hypogaea]
KIFYAYIYDCNNTASTLQQLIAKNWCVRLLDIHSNFVELKEFFQEKQMENYKHQQLIKKIIEEQEQETKNKKNQEQQGGYSVEERTTVGGGRATATAKAVDIAPRLTSFLEKDESFLTPWSWDSNSSSSSLNQQGRKSHHQFQPGSFFVREYPEYFGSHNYYPGPNQSDSKKPNP